MPLRVYTCSACNLQIEKLIAGFNPPNTQVCINCHAKMFLNTVNRVAMQPDQYWAGHQIEAIGLNNVTSKSYLKRYLRDNHIAQITSDEIGHKMPTQKTHKERLTEHLNKPEVVRARRKVISETLDGFGVIDGVK